MQVTPSIAVPDEALSLRFVRSTGPGGQNVNKVATAVELRIDLARSGLSSAVQARALKLSGQRATKEREIVIFAQRHRTQVRNRRDAEQRLIDLLRRALVRQPPRIPTRPSGGVKRRREDAKKHRSSVKRRRDKPRDDS